MVKGERMEGFPSNVKASRLISATVEHLIPELIREKACFMAVDWSLANLKWNKEQLMA
ncbi:MAG: hypothetical protein LBQ12_04360 [Deltaproteobacteria bacterium]|jgi:hypothetical protein|nr:hypothetical protein [Deltaproteobacteria bacterium]